MIPKVIHFCWFGGNPFPKDVKKCIKSWKEKCPDYEIKEWNETNFDVQQNSFVKVAYESKAWAFVSDYARLKVIYDNGGIYLDTDVELVKSLNSLLENDCFVGVQQGSEYIATGLGFGASKHNEMIKEMLLEYDGIIFDNNNRQELACPILNTKPFYKYGYHCSDEVQVVNGVHIYPPRFFAPYDTVGASNLMCNDTISIHHYSASWTKGRNRFKRKLVNLIGDANVIKIRQILKI